MKLRFTIVSIIISIIFTACSPGSQSATVEPTQSLQQSPEYIVQEFLTDFQEAPMQLDGYLSTSLRGLYPPEQRADILPIEGMIEGFAVQSAAITPESAQIDVALNSGGMDAILQFNLIRENGNWVIDSIFAEP